MKELTDFLDKYNIKYTINGDCVEVEGDLELSRNQLTSLPESFGKLKVGGWLALNHNRLTSLPESFGNLKVGTGLSLNDNQLTSLPESFGKLKVGGSLQLDGNKLTSLPESFGNLKVGGYLFLSCNQLTSLPESFGNLKIGREVSLIHNNLASFPKILSMSHTIESDWCFFDGVVREIVSRETLGGLTIIKTPFDYVVGDDSTFAHGKTLEEAKKDYVYRAVTRSCRKGVYQWMSSKTFPEQVSIRDIIQLTQSAYGGDRFREFFQG